MKADAGLERDGGSRAVIGDGIVFCEDGHGVQLLCDGKQRLVEEGEDDAVVEAFTVVGMQAVVRLVGKAEGFKLGKDLGRDGGRLLLGGGFCGGGIGLGVAAFEFVGEPAHVDARAAGECEQQQSQRQKDAEGAAHGAHSFLMMMAA